MGAALGTGLWGTEVTQVHHQRCEHIIHPSAWKMHLRGAPPQIKALSREWRPSRSIQKTAVRNHRGVGLLRKHEGMVRRAGLGFFQRAAWK